MKNINADSYKNKSILHFSFSAIMIWFVLIFLMTGFLPQVLECLDEDQMELTEKWEKETETESEEDRKEETKEKSERDE